jgi:hypothetical protein
MIKKIILSLAIAFSGYCSYAQTDVSGDTTAIGLGATSTNWAYKFTYQNHSIAHYGLGWYNDLDLNGGPMAYIGGYGGIKLFTAGAPRLDINYNGNVGIGTTNPTSKLDIYGNNERFHIGTSNGDLAIGQWDAVNNRIESVGRSLYLTTYTGVINLGISGNTSLSVANSGNVLIGKTSQANTNYKLDVSGSARADKIVVNTTGADFVFDKKYTLPKLSYVRSYIYEHHHLPEIPSDKQMQANGLELGEMNTKLLQKVEELTLYAIQQREENHELKKVSQVQEARIAALEKALLKQPRKHLK